MYNILLGGAAGQGVDTTAAILEKLLKRAGYHILTVRDFMSRIRGGHNFMLLRFGPEPVYSHDSAVNAIVALNEETYRLHEGELLPGGFILCDSALAIDDPRAIKLDMAQMAKTLGNPKVAGVVAVGAILKLFGESLDDAEGVLPAFVKEQYLEINLKALKAGYDAVEARYPHLSGDASGDVLISGSKAMALGALAAGLTFYSAYPMSPATPVLESLAEVSKAANIVVEQAEDEIAAINMAIGASFAGARAMTGTSGGGFSLMVEALGLSGMAEIPVVIVNVQRPGPVTGLPTRTEQSDLLFTVSASQGEFPRLVIAPTNPEDAFYQTMRAFDLAEKYQIPVLLLSDQYLGDSSYTVPKPDPHRIFVSKPAEKHEGPEEYLRYRYTESGVSPRLLPGFAENLVTADSDEHDERGAITESAEVRNRMMEKRMKKIDGLAKELKEPEFIGTEDFETLLIGWGSTWGPIREALNILNSKGVKKYAALIFSDVYPLPTKRLTEKAAMAKELVNVEQNFTGQLAKLIRMETGIRMSRSVLKYDGRQISGREIAEQLAKEGVQ
jgi:2-oxoglutarate ferredoxin oxidoreductase subunit alpha